MTDKKPNAYVGKVTARTGVLLGGVKTHQSSPFADWREVVRWCDEVIENNKASGRDPMYDGIRMVYSSNPIQ
ncbi:MAG: hypothetical protein ACXAEN_22370 [Candidatus Thorarchaeota archaeon]